jgi:hypothetical protein
MGKYSHRFNVPSLGSVASGSKRLGTSEAGLGFFLLERPNLFAVCYNTFSKWWESVKDGL